MRSAEPAAQHQTPIAWVRPEVRVRVIVACGAVALLAAEALAFAVVGTRSTGLMRIATWVAVLVVGALIRTAGWQTLREVRTDSAALVVVHADRTELSVPLADIAALGYSGTVVAGRLFDGLVVRGSNSG